MKLLDRIVRAILLCCMFALAGYIIVESVTIAGENGFFRNTPILSAIYAKLETWTAGTYIPVLSYAGTEAETEDLLDGLAKEAFPLYGYAGLQNKTGTAVESADEYELIVRAQAYAEENKQPQELPAKTEENEYQENETEDAGLSYETLLNRYFSMDVTTTIDAERLDAQTLLSMDMTMEKREDAPQILIYHTHSQEAFADSVEGDTSTTIVGVGEYLAQILREQYGYQVIHETGVFDLVDGVLDRSAAYDYSLEAVEAILEEYPSVEVVIDLHRDGVDGKKMVTEYKGKPTAKLMFIAGMSRTADGNDITYLPNPYIQENLAFALQLTMAGDNLSEDLMRNIYLMAYRFNLHLRPKSLLVEAGTQLSTVEEERNAMEALAEILDSVLSGQA